MTTTIQNGPVGSAPRTSASLLALQHFTHKMIISLSVSHSQFSTRPVTSSHASSDLFSPTQWPVLTRTVTYLYTALISPRCWAQSTAFRTGPKSEPRKTGRNVRSRSPPRWWRHSPMMRPPMKLTPDPAAPQRQSPTSLPKHGLS